MEKNTDKVGTNNHTLLGRFFNPSTKNAILAIVILSVSVKVGYIVALGGGLGAFPVEGSDVSFYETAAQNLLRTGTYSFDPGKPTTAMPPGQPFFLALLYAASDNSFAFAKLAHVALLTAVAVLTFLTGKKLASATVGFWAGVLIAIDPAQTYLSGTFLSEPLFIFLMVFGIYLLARDQSHQSALLLIASGLCFGLAGLTRNQGWLFSAALFFGAITTLGRLMPIRAAAIVLITTLATVAPWTLRNYQVSSKFIPVSSEGGLTLWASNNPEFVFRPPMPMSLPIYNAPAALVEDEVDQYYRHRALDWILAHPLDFLFNGLRKVYVLYNFDPQSWRPEVAGIYRVAGFFPYGLLIPFIPLGLLMHLRNPRFYVVLLYILFTTAMAFVFYGDSRIRAPIQPYLYLFGVLGVQAFVNWLRARNRGSAQVDVPQGEG